MDEKDTEETINKDTQEQLKDLFNELTVLKQQVEELKEKIRAMEPNFF